MVYVSNISRPSNQKLVAEQYKVSVKALKKRTSPDFKSETKYRFYNGKHMESHLYEGIQPGEFYDKLENVFASQKSAFKVNIALGYDLVSFTDNSETRYFHPNIGNTFVFNAPIAIISKADIRKKIISEIRSMELAEKLNYPSSGYKGKAITGFKIYIYHRNHALGDNTTVIPKIISDNKHIINFSKTNNKCVFHCIAYHTQQEPKKDLRRIQDQVKDAQALLLFQGYLLHSESVQKLIDLLQLDDLVDCFQLGIDVYKMDVTSGKVECILCSDKEYDAMYNLLHENHAIYIKNVDMLQRKYECAKCKMVFVSSINPFVANRGKTLHNASFYNIAQSNLEICF